MSMIYQPMPSVVSKATWGAKPSQTGNNRQTTNKIVVHHSATPQSRLSANTEYQEQQAIQSGHLAKGYTDIAYHFCIGKNASILEGRKESYVSYASASTATTFDEGAIHICIHGHFHDEPNVTGDNMTLSTSQRAKLLDLVCGLCYRYNVTPNNIFGHCDNGNSLCPGDNIYTLLPTLRNDAAIRLYGVEID